MSKATTEHAAAAKLIRQALKSHNIAGTVRAKSYAGGSSITVTLNNEAPWVAEAVSRFADTFQYGHFDGMVDCYEFSNSREDIPQVKFVFVTNEISDELRQQAYDWLRANWAGYDELPAAYTDAQNLNVNGHWISTDVYRVVSGNLGKFWNKPRVRIPAAVNQAEAA